MRRMTALAVCAIPCCVLASSCHKKKMPEAVAKILAILPPEYHKQIVTGFMGGHLDGGEGVLVEPLPPELAKEGFKEPPAFWVKDGQVFAVNGTAKRIVPALPAAPEAVTFDRIKIESLNEV